MAKRLLVLQVTTSDVHGDRCSKTCMFIDVSFNSYGDQSARCMLPHVFGREPERLYDLDPDNYYERIDEFKRGDRCRSLVDADEGTDE